MALPAITASRAYVRNLDTGEVYYSKGTGAVYPHSLSKLLTAYILFQHEPTVGDLQGASATIQSGDQAGGTGDNLNNGDVVTLHELLYDMMIPSSNTAAMAVARVIGDALGGAGGVTRFVTEMATQASNLGMTDSSFLNPHGNSTDGATTPEDMYLLVKALYDSASISVLNPIWQLGRYRMTATRGGSPTTIVINQTNDNSGDIGYRGGKTGSMSSVPNFNAITLWEAPNGQTIYIGVLGATDADDRFDDVRAIIAQLPLDFTDLATPAVPFTPDYLFTTLGMGGAWWDGSDNATMWQDTGKTTPVSANDHPVALWEPKVAGTPGLAFAQSTSNARPLWKSATGRLTFDGSNDYLTLGATDIGATGLFCDAGEQFMTCTRSIQTSGGTILSKAGATAGDRTFQIYRDGAGADNGFYIRGAANGFSPDLADGPTVHTIGTYWDGAKAFHYTGGYLGPKQCQVGTASEEAQNIMIGARTSTSPGFYLTGSIEQVVITDEVLDLDTFRRLHDWMRGGTVNAFADPAGGVVEPAEGTGSIEAAGELTAEGYAIHSGAGAVAASASLVGAGETPAVVEAEGSGSIAGTGEIAGVGYVIRSGSGDVAGTGALAGVGDAPSLGIPEGEGTISAVGSLVGDGYVVRYGFGGIAGVGALVGEGDAPADEEAGEGGGSVVGVSAMVGAGYTTRSGYGSVSGIGALVGGSTQSAAVVVSHFLYVRPRRR